MGYLDLGSVGDDAIFAQAGVLGMLDLVAALEWVRDNIANLGGDRNNVMIFGQSGGGAKTSTLMVMPSTKGLFHKVALQSDSTITLSSRQRNARPAASSTTPRVDTGFLSLHDVGGDMRMVKVPCEFQVFVKPADSTCNLACQYCYYLEKDRLYSKGESFRMPDDLLEKYIVQHVAASPDPVIQFSWHGGEPTILGLDYFRRIVALQCKHQPTGRRIVNGIQTNGTLLDEDWCRFLAAERWAVGLSLDGPQEMHDRYRVTKDGGPTFEQAMRGYRLLKTHQVLCEILCVVHAYNVQRPIEVYRFLKRIGAQCVSLLPLVERQPEAPNGVSDRTVTPDAWGSFLCAIFDEWLARDIGRVKVQIFEEAVRPAFGQEHTLCIFRKTCGGVPVIEHNGDFFSCDHFVDEEHRLGNIRSIPLVELLDSPRQRAFGQAKWDTLPEGCRACEVVAMCHGGCPKNRFLGTPQGEIGLNYLCAGYKHFFTHCRPFAAQIAAVWRQQQKGQARTTSTQVPSRVGRNDPCPCGSGKKYKQCCMGR